MHWQDLPLSVGQIIFILALLPSILSKDKPALTTSVINSTILYIFAFIEWTIPLHFAAITVAATAFGWSILAFQKYGIDRRVRR